MDTVRRMQRLGFRRWYERELLRSHGNLVLLVLASLGLLGAAEAYSARLPLADQLQVAAAALASAAIGLLALRRYLYLLNHAEFVANQAGCPACGTYARWQPIADAGASQVLQVRCRHCEHQWQIEL